MSQYANLLSFVRKDDRATQQDQNRQVDTFENAPLYTAGVHEFVRSNYGLGSVPQYGLLGIREDAQAMGTTEEDNLIFANMNVPWSAFICGSQGAGKSHTLSCLLENALIRDNPAGKLPHPLTGLVMHYDKFASSGNSQVCEAAYLCSSGIPVTVLVSPSNIWAMTRMYRDLPNLEPGVPRPTVRPLYLDEDRLHSNDILKLMSVDPSADKAPLYMGVVLKVAREMAMEGPTFKYSEFRRRLDQIKWAPGQETPLDMRLQLLDSFVTPSAANTTKSRPAQAQENIWAFSPGSLTIIDLSDPFIGSNDACVLFTICLAMFQRERHQSGRVVVLDEAHKFLSQSGEAKLLTEDLLSVIRQQRHTGTRVLIATQEPTLSPGLIDLSNATFVHRFNSPDWYDTLKNHLAGASQNSDRANSIFETIVGLQTGEALLFCPTAQMDIDYTRKSTRALGSGYAKIRVRSRLTADGGRSIMATDISNTNDGPYRESIDDVPMFTVDPGYNSGPAPTHGYNTRAARYAAKQRTNHLYTNTTGNGYPSSSQQPGGFSALRGESSAGNGTPSHEQGATTPLAAPSVHESAPGSARGSEHAAWVPASREATPRTIRGVASPFSFSGGSYAGSTNDSEGDRTPVPMRSPASPSNTRGVSSPSQVLSPSVKEASKKRRREELRDEVIKQAEVIFKDNWQEFNGSLSKAQRDTIAACIEGPWKLESGSLAKNQVFLAVCQGDAVRQLNQLKKRHKKSDLVKSPHH